jgi:hypothetical protein
MAATWKSTPLTWEQGVGAAAWPCFFDSGLRRSLRIRRLPLACPRLRCSVAAKGYEVAEAQVIVKQEEEYYISEEDKRFVNALQESQPYVYLYRGSTFVVVISGELLATPYSLDTLLKVLSLSLSLSLSDDLHVCNTSLTVMRPRRKTKLFKRAVRFFFCVFWDKWVKAQPTPKHLTDRQFLRQTMKEGEEKKKQ